VAFPKHRLAAAVAVINDDKKVLLIKNWKRGWEFPGGYVENGESAIDAAIREVKEEAGIQVQLKRFCGITQDVENSRCTLIFLGEPVNKDQLIAQDDAIDAGYFSLDEALLKIKVKVYKEIIVQCLKEEEYFYLIESNLSYTIPDFIKGVGARPVFYVSISTEEAIARYKANYESYAKHELMIVNQYREAYKNIKGSLADQVIERAIWYMDQGYIVYGSGLNSYHYDGVVDCSGFTKLVYGDFGFELTGIAKKYDQIGTRVAGVYPMQTNKYWYLAGVSNLRPGDILTWWLEDSDGKYIGHVGIYMGQINGSPAVLCTTKSTPTAIGIITKFKRWYGKHFFSAQRILPEGSWTLGKVIVGHEDKGPVIPKQYVLPPQKPIVMPDLS
jgi:8-oxo-dGTP pyrophosphatase MutT (NUDIX family)